MGSTRFAYEVVERYKGMQFRQNSNFFFSILFYSFFKYRLIPSFLFFVELVPFHRPLNSFIKRYL